MIDIDRWQEIVATMGKNRLRTFLTACGVFWGLFMLIVMVGFGRGLERGVKKRMSGFATNSVYVWGHRTSVAYKGLKPGRSIRFSNEDTAALRAKVSGARFICPRGQLGGFRNAKNVTRKNKAGSFRVMGDYPEFQYVQPAQFVRGRFLNRFDIERRRKVAVIGDEVYQLLFEEDEDPIGETIKIRGAYFEVVGHFRPLQGGNRGQRHSTTIYIPFTTFQTTFSWGNRVGWFAITVREGEHGSEVEKRVKEVLAVRQRISPDDPQAMGSFNAEKEFAKMTRLFAGIEVLIWIVGVMTLLAGLIGVSNIMLIAVKERTREIGIRRTVGATAASIVGLIVQESIALTAVAGYLGLVAGVGALELIGMAVGDGSDFFSRPEVDLRVALVAGAALLVGGAVAGIIPAAQAARVDPVEAVRA